MECPTCGYVFQPFETTCPRCARQPKPAAGTARAAMPAPANAPPVTPAMGVNTRENGKLLALVAVLSVACIYLSGVVMGNYMAQQKRPDSGVRYTNPSLPAQQPPIVPLRPFHDPYEAQEQKDCAQFVGKIQILEAERHTMMLAHSLPPLPPNIPSPRVRPMLTLPVAGVEMTLLQTEAANLRQMSQDLERTPITGSCYALRNDYRQYLVDIEEAYQQIIRARELENTDPIAAQKIRNDVDSAGMQRLHNDASRAETSLLALCTIKGVPKVFRLDWRGDNAE